MPNKFNKNKVAQLLIDSIDESRLEYDRLNEALLSDAPEYFKTVNSLKKLSNEFNYDDVTMEWNVRDALDDIKNKNGKTGKKPGRPFSGLRENGRFDIVLWKEDLPWGIVEVKKDIWTTEKYIPDIKRIRAVLKTAENFDKELTLNCFFLFYLQREDDRFRSKRAEHKILDFLRSMQEKVESELNDEFSFNVARGEPVRYKGEFKNWAQQPFCFIIHN